tara:strand:+ start:1083 stop:1808 length:726 start_codon:yes stop_codon:yes gene_type:complete
MKIVLATQGSQGVLALYELFSLGYKPDEIEVLICSSGASGPLIEFVNYNQISYELIHSSQELDSWLEPHHLIDHLLLSISWKFKISSLVIEAFQSRVINLHPGLLPEYKGCFSTPWAIINEEQFSGFTYHFVNEDYDKGDIILRRELEIDPFDTAFSLYYKIITNALKYIGEVLGQANTPGKPQEQIGTYYKNELPYDGKISAKWDVRRKENFIRAMYFPPHEPAYEMVEGKKKYYLPRQQ